MIFYSLYKLNLWKDHASSEKYLRIFVLGLILYTITLAILYKFLNIKYIPYFIASDILFILGQYFLGYAKQKKSNSSKIKPKYNKNNSKNKNKNNNKNKSKKEDKKENEEKKKEDIPETNDPIPVYHPKQAIINNPVNAL